MVSLTFLDQYLGGWLRLNWYEFLSFTVIPCKYKKLHYSFTAFFFFLNVFKAYVSHFFFALLRQFQSFPMYKTAGLLMLEKRNASIRPYISLIFFLLLLCLCVNLTFILKKLDWRDGSFLHCFTSTIMLMFHFQQHRAHKMMLYSPEIKRRVNPC